VTRGNSKSSIWEHNCGWKKPIIFYRYRNRPIRCIITGHILFDVTISPLSRFGSSSTPIPLDFRAQHPSCHWGTLSIGKPPATTTQAYCMAKLSRRQWAVERAWRGPGCEAPRIASASAPKRFTQCVVRFFHVIGATWSARRRFLHLASGAGAFSRWELFHNYLCRKWWHSLSEWYHSQFN